MEKLTNVGSKDFLVQLGENSQRFKPRDARIWNEGRRMRLCREHTFSGGASPSPTEIDVLSAGRTAEDVGPYGV